MTFQNNSGTIDKIYSSSYENENFVPTYLGVDDSATNSILFVTSNKGFWMIIIDLLTGSSRTYIIEGTSVNFFDKFRNLYLLGGVSLISSSAQYNLISSDFDLLNHSPRMDETKDHLIFNEDLEVKERLVEVSIMKTHKLK